MEGHHRSYGGAAADEKGILVNRRMFYRLFECRFMC